MFDGLSDAISEQISGGTLESLWNFAAILKQMADNPILIIFGLFAVFLIIFSTMQLVKSNSTVLKDAIA